MAVVSQSYSRQVAAKQKNLFQPVGGKAPRVRRCQENQPSQGPLTSCTRSCAFTALEAQPHQEQAGVTSAQPLTPQSLSMDILARPYTSATHTQFINSLIVGKDDVEVLEEATRVQSNSPWLAVDGSLHQISTACKCHEEVVVELKCPLTCKDTAPNANILSYLYESPDGVQLKQNHAYYAQF
ncbi:hypothetical protein Bbelb_334600 [Branchiostoma belcheri]|nr:hypothetical protein Bbelb_334600 [Branchiostoma belcheri]